ncbi:MAG: acyl-CoA dehydrogenase family protein, partial [Chloroflexi bacterium]|nr:acyl-CoA dehydrogenase family protein [Chloroflexota bacterium]
MNANDTTFAMDFSFTPEQERFRLEVREFLDRELPHDHHDVLPGTPDPAEVEFARTFERKVAARGWLLMHWPKEYEGGGASLIEQGVFAEEYYYRHAPSANPIGIFTAGPIIFTFGTEEQKRRYLPGIARSELIFAEGYSEPEAGSDLASLRTRADQRGDEYVVNGQKAFNTLAHYGDVLWLAGRTDPDAPRHRGISLFVVDMHAPGITVRPHKGLDGALHSDVFLVNVRVPAANLIGEKNKGWSYIGFGLYGNITPLREWARLKRTLDDLAQYCRETQRDGRPMSKDLLVRHRLTEMALDLECWHWLAWKTLWMQHAKQP